MCLARSQDNIIIMSPNPNEEISNNEVLIAVSFYQIDKIAPSEINLLIDGKEISSRAFIDKDMLSCLVENLSPGKHRITLILGNRMRPKMIPDAKIPEIKPYAKDLFKNGHLINRFVAPTNCILLIKNL